MGSRRRTTNRNHANVIRRSVDAGDSGSSQDGPSSKDNRNSKAKRPKRSRRRLIFENLGQRRLLAVITGSVYHDADGSMRPDSTEVRLPGRLVYIDANDNASFDNNETFAIGDADGQFRFEHLQAGEYSIRLFDGSANQRQTFPIGAKQARLPGDHDNPVDVVLAGNQLNVLSAGGLLQIDTSGTRTSQISLDFNAGGIVTAVSSTLNGVGSASIISGTFTELGQERSGLWLVPAGSPEAKLLHDDANPHAFASPAAAVGADGKGVVIAAGQSADDEGVVHVIQISRASDSGSVGDSVGVEVSATSVTVPSNTQVVSSAVPVDFGHPSAVGSRSVMAWPIATTTTPSGTESQITPALRTSLWSNSAADWISGSETVIVGATELISFDDAAGLLAVRYAQGGVGILDVDAGFAPLHQFDSLQGPSAFVPGQEALVSFVTNETGAMLLLHDIRDGKRLASHPVDTEIIGNPVAILPGATIDSYYLVGESGSSTVKLKNPAAHRVTLRDTDASAAIEFGVRLNGIGVNASPDARGEITAQGVEDGAVRIDASEIAALVADADRDRLVSLIALEPEHGTVTFRPDGGLDYRPEPDYSGTDTFAIRFHDGQSASQPIAFTISIASQPDLPSGITFRGDAIPEHTEGRYEVGSIDIQDADVGDQHSLDVFDARFIIEDGTLILVNGGLDYELEPEIVLTISGFDDDAGDYFYHDIVVYVEDENDPIEYVWAHAENVIENEEGAFVAWLTAFDTDEGQTITFSVDDTRFETIGDKLWLKQGESIDYESDPFVVLTITADDHAGSTASTELHLPIIDVPESISEITLSNKTVLELELGATVGEVQLDGVPAADSYELTVNDPRFEIDGSTLKLVDGQYVRRSAAEQIELTITAQDRSAVFDAISATFVIQVLENQTPFHNDENPFDVDGNGNVSPLDALAIINYLNLYGPGSIGPGDPGFGYDVNGDGQISALDALLVINILNTLQNGGTVGGGVHSPAAENGPPPSGEQTPAPPPADPNTVIEAELDDLNGTQSVVPQNDSTPSGDLLHRISNQFSPGVVNDAPETNFQENAIRPLASPSQSSASTPSQSGNESAGTESVNPDAETPEADENQIWLLGQSR